jgi:hypothetical protein
MTPQEQAQFDDFGCLSRALIALSNAFYQPITTDQFCTRFRNLFVPGKFGGLYVSRIPEIVTALGSADGFVIHRRYQDVLDYYQNGARKILIQSEIRLWPLDATDVFRHVTILKTIDQAGLKVWNPHSETTGQDIDLTAGHWDTKLCVAVIFGG